MAEEFLETVRRACPVGIWSQGVKLARDGAVTLAEEKPAEVTLRVRERGRAVAPTVILYPPDGEWDCDCESRGPMCNHVAAASIAWAQRTFGDAAPEAREGASEAAPSPSPAARARLAYALSVDHGALRLDRSFVTTDGSEKKLTLSLLDRTARGIQDPPFDPSHDDIAIDRVVYKKIHGDIPLDHIRTVLEALAHHPDVRFGGAPASTSGEWVYPKARVEDGPREGVRLVIATPPDCEVIAMGTARVRGTLRPLGETKRFGLRWEKLPVVGEIPPRDFGTLVGETLPDLERTMLVEVSTRRLPSRKKRVVPRIEVEISHELGALFALPLLVYGDPPVARVDAGRLVMLEQGAAAPVRDEGKEHELVLRLRDELEMVPGRRVRFDGREASRFVARLEAFRMADPSAKTVGDAAGRRELVPRIVQGPAGIEILFELPLDDAGSEGARAEAKPRAAKLEDVAAAYRDGLPIVALDGGGFAHLPAAFLAKHGQAILDLVAARPAGEEIPKTAYPVLLEVAEALGVELPSVASVVEPLARDFAGIPAADVPAHLASILRPYQRRGVDWLAFLRDAGLGGLLADDMGLGKTLQILCALRGPALVVCPRSVVHNWASEIKKFRPELEVAFYEGPRRVLDQSADVTLTTYAVLRIDADKLASVDWTMVVLDEAQNIKNPDSQAARAAFRLRADARFALTGTPVENRLEDLWSLLRFSNQGLLGPRRDFVERFAGPIAEGSADAAKKLEKRIRPFVLRRTKGDVLRDLPPRTETTMFCELSEEERALYAAVLAATKREIMERLGAGEGVLAMLEALLRLRQAACHTGLLPGREAESSAKVDRLVEALAELAAEGHKALVFSQWTSLLDKIEPHLAREGLAFTRLDGSTRDRGAVVSAFQDEQGPPVMLLSLKAGGVGLNLTAADHVFLVDPWWNPAVEEQAADRAHRIGQDKPVIVYRMVAKDTVEERILLLQEKKRRLADAVVSGAGGATAITRDDLLELLVDA